MRISSDSSALNKQSEHVSRERRPRFNRQSRPRGVALQNCLFGDCYDFSYCKLVALILRLAEVPHNSWTLISITRRDRLQTSDLCLPWPTLDFYYTRYGHKSSTNAHFDLACSPGLFTADLPRIRGRTQLFSHDLLVSFTKAKSNMVRCFNTRKKPPINLQS